MNRRLSSRTQLILGLVLATGWAAGPASAANYLGSGQFSSNQINWCHAGDYATECQNAAAKWSAVTDLDIYSNCSSIKAWTIGTSYGATGWAGYAYICNTGGGCENYNATYSDCTARNNSYYLATWTSTQRQFNATHELGHCWSLAHRPTDSTSIMQQGQLSITNPNATDQSLVNARY